MFGLGKRDIYTIYDPDRERKIKFQQKFFLFSLLVSFALLSYPVFKDIAPKWNTYRAASGLSLYLSMIRNQALLKNTPLEVRFLSPNQIEVYETTSCGPQATYKKLWDSSLTEFAESIEFVNHQWIREHMNPQDPIFSRYCYDPLFGSSIAAEGFARGSVYLAHRQSIDEGRTDEVVQIFLEGPSGDVDFD